MQDEIDATPEIKAAADVMLDTYLTTVESIIAYAQDADRILSRIISVFPFVISACGSDIDKHIEKGERIIGDCEHAMLAVKYMAKVTKKAEDPNG